MSQHNEARLGLYRANGKMEATILGYILTTGIIGDYMSSFNQLAFVGSRFLLSSFFAAWNFLH